MFSVPQGFALATDAEVPPLIGGWVGIRYLCGRCTGVAVPLRVVPSPTGLQAAEGGDVVERGGGPAARGFLGRATPRDTRVRNPLPGVSAGPSSTARPLSSSQCSWGLEIRGPYSLSGNLWSGPEALPKHSRSLRNGPSQKAQRVDSVTFRLSPPCPRQQSSFDPSWWGSTEGSNRPPPSSVKKLTPGAGCWKAPPTTPPSPAPTASQGPPASCCPTDLTSVLGACTVPTPLQGPGLTPGL